MCAVTQPGSNEALPQRLPEETIQFAGRSVTDKLMAKLGPERAVWVDIDKGTAIQIARFSRPSDDERPPVGHTDAHEICPFVPVP